MRLTVAGDMFCCMNSEHKTLLSRLVELPKKKQSKQFSADYTGSDHKAYFISSPDMRALVKDWLKDTAHLSARQVFEVVESLMAGVSHEEKKMAAYVLGYRRDARAVTGIGHLDDWLDDLTGWAEVDTLCQNVFTSKETVAGLGRLGSVSPQTGARGENRKAPSFPGISGRAGAQV